MRAKILARLDVLRAEYANGLRAKAELEAQQDVIYEQIDTLDKTMLRITGAIQVLEEVAATEETPSIPTPNPSPLHGEGSQKEKHGCDAECDDPKERSGAVGESRT